MDKCFCFEFECHCLISKLQEGIQQGRIQVLNTTSFFGSVQLNIQHDNVPESWHTEVNKIIQNSQNIGWAFLGTNTSSKQARLNSAKWMSSAAACDESAKSVTNSNLMIKQQVNKLQVVTRLRGARIKGNYKTWTLHWTTDWTMDWTQLWTHKEDAETVSYS